MPEFKPHFTLLPRVDYSLNEADQSVLELSASVFQRSEVGSFELINRIYRHAFSCGDYLLEHINAENLKAFHEEKTPAIFEKMSVPGAVRKKAILVPERLQSGDLVVSRLYNYPLLYIRGKLYHTRGRGLTEADMEREKIQSDIATAVLRPALALKKDLARTDMEKPKTVLTPEQTSLVATAKAYWLRGEWVRYADTRFNAEGESLRGEFRWRVGCNPPEFCNDFHRGYTNCAAFVYDCYYYGLGFPLPDAMFTTHRLAERSKGNGTQVYCYEREPGSRQSPEEQERVQQEFLSVLEPGDILVLRRENGSGHALLYAGDGVLYHSTGKVFDYEKGREQEEASIQRGTVQDYFFNEKLNPQGYVFSVAKKLVVVRPLQVYAGGVPEAAQNRVKHLDGVVVKKTYFDREDGQLGIGDLLTYIYTFTNYNDYPVELELRDVLPEHLQARIYEGSDGETAEGYQETISLTFKKSDKKTTGWELGALQAVREAVEYRKTITVPARATVCELCAGFVKGDTKPGTLIDPCNCTVSGVPVPCEKTFISGRLRPAERRVVSKVYFNMKKYRHFRTGGVEMVNLFYKALLDVEKILPADSFDQIVFGPEGCFKEYPTDKEKPYYQKNPEGWFSRLMVPGFYGGRYLWTPEFEYDRTTLPLAQNLQAGDILFYQKDGEKIICLYTEKQEMVQIAECFMWGSRLSRKGLEQLLSADYFVALRPVMLRSKNQEPDTNRFRKDKKQQISAHWHCHKHTVRSTWRQGPQKLNRWKEKQELGIFD